MSQPESVVEADWQDALQFLSPPSPPGATPMLEVHQVWGNLIVDSRQYGPDTDPVRIGEGTATRWTFLGVDMGRVPPSLRPVLAVVAPLWSEFETAQRFDFRVPDGIDEGWALFVADGEGGYVARIPPGWDHVAEIDGQMVDAPSTPADDGASEVRMADVSRLVVERGEFRFVARRAPRSARLEARMGQDTDPWFLGMLCAATVLFVGVALLAGLASPIRGIADQELDEPLVAMLLAAPPPPTVEVGNQGAKAKAGPDHSKQKAPRKSPSRISKVSKAKDVAETAGIFSDDAPILDEALPTALVAGASHLIGSHGGEPGGDGLDGRAGGGCEAGSLLCGGNYEGHGGDGLRDEGGIGRQPGGPVKQTGETLLPTSDAIVIGALDKAVIDEVVKNHTAAIRYCYQRELQRSPGLAGKVVVKFTISRDGSVSAAALKASTMGSPGVENCIVSRFMRMAFPAPRGGGIVVVSYPFLFAPN